MATTANRLYPYPIASDNVRPYEDIQALADAVDADVNPIFTAWTAYTPTHTSDTGSPTLGTGGVVGGRYKQIGKTVHYRGRLKFGTGASFGTGGWYVSLPVASINSVIGSTSIPHLGAAYYRDQSASTNYSGICGVFPDLNASRLAFYYGTTQIQFTQPFTWAVDDHLSWDLTYEAA